MPTYQSRVTNLPLRPLTEGMVVDIPPNLIGKGAFSYLNNYFIDEKGLRKRPGITYSNQATLIALAPPFNRFVTLGSQDGSEITLLMDQKYVYSVSGGVLNKINDVYAVGHITALHDDTTHVTITGDSTLWATLDDYDLLPDDEIRVYNGTVDPANLVFSSTINSIDSDTSIKAASATVTNVTGVNYHYEIHRIFVNPNNTPLDICEAYIAGTNYILITDGVRYPRMCDGSTLTRFAPNYDYVCQTISYFGDRVWMGNMIMDGAYWRDRYIWSTALDKQVFDADAVEDKPETVGVLVKLLPLGKKLVAYFNDAIYLGTRSNIKGLPYVFDKIEYAGLGIAGLRAVGNIPLGHLIVGQSNTYILTEDGQLYPMNSGVMDTYLPTCAHPEKIIVLYDANNDNIVIGLPETSETDISRWFTYNWKLKAWSLFTFLAQTADVLRFINAVSYDSLGDPITYDSLGNPVTYDNIGQSLDAPTIYFGENSSLAYLTLNDSYDLNNAAIPAHFATPSFDLDQPDQNKTFMRLSIRLYEPSTIPLVFNVSCSIDEYNYQTGAGLLIPIGNLTIQAGRLEGFITFKKTASTLEFHVTQSVSDSTFHIREYVISFTGRGLETKQSVLYGTN